MNFFEQQTRARGQSRRLVLLFALAVLGIVGAIDIVVAVAVGVDGSVGLSGVAGTLVATTLITLAVIFFASLYKTATLRAGGGAVARQFGGIPVAPDTIDPRYRRLRNVVEEIAIASGVPVPEIYVLEQESAINAFAAGYSTADAAVTVTRGCLEKLTRDELQGVIAHEFSHILNGDMRLNIRLIGLLFGILVIGNTAARVLSHGSGRSSSRDGKSSGGIVVVILAIMIIGYIGVFFGRMIKAGVSRSREYLADASAVQFTRQTSGIAGALKKISGLAAGSKLQNAGTEEVSHMLFGDGVGYSSLFATHPPVLKRIRAMEPGFQPEQIQAESVAWNAPDYRAEIGDDIRGTVSLAAPGDRIAIVAGSVISQVGRPGADDYLQAEGLHRSLPQALKDAARSDAQAVNLVLALLIDTDAGIGQQQLALIPAREVVAALLPAVRGLHPAQRLPLLSLAFPMLRRRPQPELIALLSLTAKLSQADGRISVFEYSLGRLLMMQVSDALHPAAAGSTGRRKLDDAADDLRLLLSVLARNGNADPAAAKQAFLAGINAILPKRALSYRAPEDWPPALDRALRGLDQLEPAGKRLLIEGLVATLKDDGRVTVAEAELLRVICAALHCPLPPLLDTGASIRNSRAQGL